MSGHIYTQSEIFAVVRQLLKKYHAESAILFGSYARQEADAASDIDLIVVGGSKFDPTDIFCIAEELHRTMGNAERTAGRTCQFGFKRSYFPIPRVVRQLPAQF